MPTLKPGVAEKFKEAMTKYSRFGLLFEHQISQPIKCFLTAVTYPTLGQSMKPST